MHFHTLFHRSVAVAGDSGTRWFGANDSDGLNLIRLDTI